MKRLIKLSRQKTPIIFLIAAFCLFALLVNCTPYQEAINSVLDSMRILNSGKPEKLDNVFSAKYKTIHGGIIIYVQINESSEELLFLLDTAAPTVVDTSVAKKLKLSPYKSLLVSGAGGKTEKVRTTKIDSLKIGPVKVNNMIPIVMDLKSDLKNEGLDLDGVLGHTFWKHFIFTVDPRKEKIYFVPRGSKGKNYIARELEKDNVIKLKLKHLKRLGNLLFLETQIDGKGNPSHFVVDTGNTGSIIIPAKLAEILGYSFSPDDAIKITGLIGKGATQNIYGGYIFKVNNIKFGNKDFGPCRILATDIFIPNVGLKFLTNYRFTIDFENLYLVLVPPKDKIDLDCLTTFGFASNNKWGITKIATIISTSPAADVNLEIGDEILEINGKPIPFNNNYNLNIILNDPDVNEIVLKIKSNNGQIRDVKLIKRCIFD